VPSASVSPTGSARAGYPRDVLTRGTLSPGRGRDYVRYAVVGHHFVEGWLESLGIQLIDAVEDRQRELGVTGPIAEIGVHHGKLFILLSLLRRPGERAVAVDLFEDQERNVDRSGRGDRERFMANLQRHQPNAPDVVVRQADSNDLDGPALRALAGAALRIVSVDGGHTADLTEHDLATACDALTDGGVVILDDCFNEVFPAVSEGAQRFLRNRTDIRAVGAGGNKTFLCHETYGERYREAIAQRAARLHLYTQHHEFVGAPFLSVFPRTRRAAVPYWLRYTRGWVTSRLRMSARDE
jgi:Methyltransferase domain